MTGAVVGIPGDESALVARLDLEQKVRLLTGRDSWVLHNAAEIGLRHLVMSDGPAGVRGVRFDAANPSSSLPCPVALGATWDVALVEELALALGHETRAKGIDVLLAPTVNIIRTPLSGRGFECFSEDPLLSALIAAAFVRGVQRAGVGATAKHYVANDSETERRTYDARISETVLRELYLPPFEACVAEGVMMIMAAYNSVNGATMTANAPLLKLLKDEWGFDGVVVSDWHAASLTVETALAGLDLVMPGPHGPWGDRLAAAVRDGLVPEAAIDDKVQRVLALARRVGALDGHVDGSSNGAQDGHVAGTETPIDPGLLSRVTARSFVLLTNPRGLLPLPKGKAGRIALIGPNAVEPQLQGGGSVRVLPIVRPGLAEALAESLDAYVTIGQGCSTGATIALPAPGLFHDPVSGLAGVHLEVKGPEGEVLRDLPYEKSVITWWDPLPAEVHQDGSQIAMRTIYRPTAGGRHVIGVGGIGRTRVLVDGKVAGEGVTTHPARDVVFVLSQPPEVRVPVDLRAGQAVDIRVEHHPDVHGRQPGFVTLRLGIAADVDDDALMIDAVTEAAAADVAVVVVGSADGTESEGYDRDTMSLPGRQDELISRVAGANQNTIVIVNSGMPVLMPWAANVAAVIQAWFPGQAFGEALADVLSGAAEPGGRLPVSIPRAEADAPVLTAYPDAGRLSYDEGLLVGYRGYDRAGVEPLFAFGHGLGYAAWVYESIQPASATLTTGEDMRVVVKVRNTGSRSSREMVQLYLEGPDGDPSRPVRTLAAFAGVTAAGGETVEAHLTIPARSFTTYDGGAGAWVPRPGSYSVRAGRSSRELTLSAEVRLA